MSQVLATAASHLASWSLGPSPTSALHRSRFIGMTCLYLTFTSPSTTASELHTCTTQAKRHVAHIAFAMVGLVTTQSSSWITLTITYHKMKRKGTFQPYVRNRLSSEITLNKLCQMVTRCEVNSSSMSPNLNFVWMLIFFKVCMNSDNHVLCVWVN
jgi:hypothetical protein